MPPRASLARAAVSNSPRPFLHHASAPARYQHHHHNYHTNATLTGHHVLITGGSRGIGKAIATRFASLNASTTIIGRHAESLQTAVQEITTTSPEGNGAALPSPTHGYITGDISTKGFWEMLVRSLVLRSTLSSSSPSSASPQTAPEGVEEEEGPWHASAFAPQPVTILVNAAGVAHNALLIRQNAAAAENVVQTNLMGTLWGCRLLGKVLVAGRARRSKDEEEGTPRVGRSIVNVSSLLAIQGGVGAAAYAASKAGVLGLTRALAGEMGPLGVRVNAIVPGYVETDMTAALQKEAREKAMERIPLKRFGTVEEIADAAVFLATNQYANNCVINLDGGMSAI